jgi:hypothetical protein
MKTFLEFMTEQAAAHVGQDQVQQKRLEIQRKLETGFGTVNKDLKQMNISSIPAADRKSKIQDRVFGTYRGPQDNDMKKASTSKGYSKTGENPNVSSKRNFPDKPPAPQTMQDRLNMMRMDIDVSHKRFRQKMDAPFQKSIPSTISKLEPKVGSLTVPQSGYPAAKKTQLAPAENQKASSGGSYKIQDKDNPTKIAKKLGISLDDLEKKNPGILKRAKRLKIGDTINR